MCAVASATACALQCGSSDLQGATLQLGYKGLASLGSTTLAGCISGLNHTEQQRVNTLAFGPVSGSCEATAADRSRQKLQFISPDAFASVGSLGQLVTVNLACNNLRWLENNTFRGLDQLHKLSFLHNSLQQLKPGMLAGLSKLVVLDLQFNEIRAIQEGAFGEMPLLEDLILQENFMVSLYPGMFRGLHQLSSVDFTNNQLQAIRAGTFSEVASTLMNLTLYGNWDIRYVGPDAFLGLRSSSSLLMTPSVLGANCSFDQSLGRVTCSCGVDPWQGIPGTSYPGGANGSCICAAGQHLTLTHSVSAAWGVPQCVPCEQGSYKPENNSDLSCLACPSDRPWTAQVQTVNLEKCKQNPQVAAAQQRAEEHKRTVTLVAASVSGAALLLGFLFAVFVVSKIKLQVQAAELERQDLLLLENEKQIQYLRDWRIKEEDLSFKEMVARGAEGEVWRGTLRGTPGEVAIKKQNQLAANLTETNKVWDEREVAFMMSLPHKRLVTFLGAGVLQDPELGPVVFMVQEYQSGGSLNNRLWGQPLASVTWMERLQWALDTAEGMQFIHQKGYTHRDLKSQNILYNASSGRAKVADFGMSRTVHTQDAQSDFRTEVLPTDSVMTGQVGTAQWMAPELCENEVQIGLKYRQTQVDHETMVEAMQSYHNYRRCHRNIHYGQAIDIYAFSMTLYEMLVHQPPWVGVKQETFLLKVSSGDRPEMPADNKAGAPYGWCELVRSCWAQDPQDRASFTSIRETLQSIQAVQKSATVLSKPDTTLPRRSSLPLASMSSRDSSESSFPDRTPRFTWAPGSFASLGASFRGSVAQGQPDATQQATLQQPLLEHDYLDSAL